MWGPHKDKLVHNWPFWIWHHIPRACILFKTCLYSSTILHLLPNIKFTCSLLQVSSGLLESWSPFPSALYWSLIGWSKYKISIPSPMQHFEQFQTLLLIWDSGLQVLVLLIVHIFTSIDKKLNLFSNALLLAMDFVLHTPVTGILNHVSLTQSSHLHWHGLQCISLVFLLNFMPMQIVSHCDILLLSITHNGISS